MPGTFCAFGVSEVCEIFFWRDVSLLFTVTYGQWWPWR